MHNLNQQEYSSVSEQNTLDFFQDSIEINFSTGLFGSKDNLISDYIIKEIQDNQLPFTVRNKQENISVLVANLFKIHILNWRPYSRTYMDANEFTSVFFIHTTQNLVLSSSRYSPGYSIL